MRKDEHQDAEKKKKKKAKFGMVLLSFLMVTYKKKFLLFLFLKNV